MEQAVQESKSLWRIKNQYEKDAKDCDECKDFWKKLEKDKEQHCQDLWDLISSHISEKKKKYYYSKGEKKVA
jgi:hypothetical protein